MQPEVINVDILDDEEPHVLVQQYVFPDQTFQVFRKPTSPDEKFALSPGEEIDPDLYWTVARTAPRFAAQTPARTLGLAMAPGLACSGSPREDVVQLL